VYIRRMVDNRPNPDSIRERYLNRISQYGHSEDSLGWRKSTAIHRYLAVSRIVNQVHPANVLDIGTGFGDLLRILRSNDWSGRFVGLDLVQEFVKVAIELAEKDSLAEFRCVDEILEFQNYRTDFAVALGLLNHVSTKNAEFRLEFLEKMLSVSRVGFAVDFLCSSANRKTDDLIYQDSQLLIDWANQNHLRWRIDHSYLRYEFLFVIEKGNSGTEDFSY
jgi:SAM-dependent methyltransferase